MDIRKEELLPYALETASRMLGFTTKQKCECGKWHNNTMPFCSDCYERMEEIENERRRDK